MAWGCVPGQSTLRAAVESAESDSPKSHSLATTAASGEMFASCAFHSVMVCVDCQSGRAFGSVVQVGAYQDVGAFKVAMHHRRRRVVQECASLG